MPGMIKAESSSDPSEASHSLLSLHSAGSTPSPSPASSSALAPPTGEERGIRLIQLLYLCADAVSCNSIENANFFLEQLSSLASITGDPIQRVASYFMQGLATRITKSWPGVHRALRLTHPSPEPERSAARQMLFNICPYLKFGFITVNQTILDAMQGEKVVHVIDLEVCGVNSSLQWVALLQAFSSRSEGPPHLRITAVNSRREVLAQMGQVLTETAERLDIPFRYHPLQITPAELLRGEMLRVRTGEAVAVTSVMQLHRLLADDNDNIDSRHPPSRLHKVSDFSNGITAGDRSYEVRKRSRDEFERSSVPRPRNGVSKLPTEATKKLELLREDDHALGLTLSVSGAPVSSTGSKEPRTIDRVLELLHGLSPKVLVVVEQESPHNSDKLHERFAPALHYYSAIFDSLNSTLPRQSSERISVERLVFGQEIENIVACEGSERVERHECLEKWRRRLEKNRFSSAHLSPTTLVQAERLLTIHSPDGYKLQREKGSLTLCWQDTPLLSVSAWTP